MLSYQANVVHILHTKNGGVCDAAENPSLLVKALCVVVFCNIYIYIVDNNYTVQRKNHK